MRELSGHSEVQGGWHVGRGRHGGADPSSSPGPARGQYHYAASGPVSDKLPRPRLDELRTVHDVEGGGRGDGGDVVVRVKGRVQDAPRKVGRQIAGRVQRRRARPPVRGLRRLERQVRRGAVGGKEVEAVLVRAGEDVSRVVVEAALELVEYAVLLVEVAQLRPQVLVHRNRLERPRLYPHIPDAHAQVVARDDVAPVSREARGGNGGGDLREERLGGRVLRLLRREEQRRRAPLERRTLPRHFLDISLERRTRLEGLRVPLRESGSGEPPSEVSRKSRGSVPRKCLGSVSRCLE
mmetsp:Transcript_49167/g.159333  ORF Transcript_49167/g.159333 Transcript_49167/m.159333 type:complete len:295 (-) Transcript_49167:939-1823(-)